MHVKSAIQSASRRCFASRGSTGTLSKNEIPKERFMNRSEWMANKFKNQNLGTYDWVPEIMTSIDPSPSYHNPSMPKKAGPYHIKRTRASEGIDEVKTGLIKKNQMEERAQTGRLLSHIKHVEMKNFIREVKSNEGTLKRDENIT